MAQWRDRVPALGAAIRQGIGLLASGEEARGGTIVLFGDGDETEDADAAREAAQLARRNAVTIHVVGVGTPDGGPVPSLDLTTGVTDGLAYGHPAAPVLEPARRPLL